MEYKNATTEADLDMLMLAARSVGIVLDTAPRGQRSDEGCHARVWADKTILFYSDSRNHPMCRPNTMTGNVEWNPLNDDGDALRLLVALGDSTRVMALSVGCDRTGCEFNFVRHGDDRGAATRRAIVIAAAEIGKKMRPVK